MENGEESLKTLSSGCDVTDNTHKHTADILVFIRLVQDQGGQNLDMNGGGGSKTPSVLEELLAVGNYWRRESYFSLGVWLLAGCS